MSITRHPVRIESSGGGRSLEVGFSMHNGNAENWFSIGNAYVYLSEAASVELINRLSKDLGLGLEIVPKVVTTIDGYEVKTSD